MMKLRTTLKIVTVASVILFCIGIAISFYFRMSSVESAEEFELYTLVPPDSKIILETDHLTDFIQHINALSTSNDHILSNFSHLLSQYYDNLQSLIDQTPHGLSKQLNKVLISIHEPVNAYNQVFYCRLGPGDEEMLEQCFEKQLSAPFSVRSFKYRGEDIRVLPLPDDKFLVYYANRKFRAFSYQINLIERVVDSYLDEKSVLDDKYFHSIHANRTLGTAATIYANLDSIGMGKLNHEMIAVPVQGNWLEFNVSMNDHAIYLSGSDFKPDSCKTIDGSFDELFPMNNVSAELLPESTVAFVNCRLTDRLIDLSDSVCASSLTGVPHQCKHYSRTVYSFLQEYAYDAMSMCVFLTDSLDTTHAVISLQLKNKAAALHALNDLRQSIISKFKPSELNRFYEWNPSLKGCIALPCNALFDQLARKPLSPSTSEVPPVIFLYVHEGQLLISEKMSSLLAYTREITQNHILKQRPYYHSIASVLSPKYAYLLSADMGKVADLATEYTGFIPHSFFCDKDFSQFIVSIQLSLEDGKIYPQLILSCKTEVI